MGCTPISGAPSSCAAAATLEHLTGDFRRATTASPTTTTSPHLHTHTVISIPPAAQALAKQPVVVCRRCPSSSVLRSFCSYFSAEGRVAQQAAGTFPPHHTTPQATTRGSGSFSLTRAALRLQQKLRGNASQRRLVASSKATHTLQSSAHTTILPLLQLLPLLYLPHKFSLTT